MLSPTWQSFVGMKNRCLNPNQKLFKDYGGRGIGICQRWLSGEGKLSGFECFLHDMGERPEGLTLDRRDNDGPYDKTNCRWATKSQQTGNARTSVIVEIEGERLHLAEAVRRFGKVKYATARKRVVDAGWDALRAVTELPLKR